MAVISNALRHPEQMPKMARALGVDLVRATADGRLRPFERHDMAYRCNTCTDRPACDAWLADNSGAAEAAPAFCRNKTRLDALRG